MIGDVVRRSPTLKGAVRIHATGSGQIPDLRRIRAVLFWLADPLRELYPECFAEAAEIARRARDAGARLANPPEALSNSIKSVQSSLWTSAGIPTPAHRRFASEAELGGIAPTLNYPVLVKGDMLHAQDRMRFCEKEVDLRSLTGDSVPIPGSVSPFVDTRAGYRTTRPDSIWARLYHKKRAMVFGGIVHPRHTIFSANPIVSLANSTIARYAQKRLRKKAFPLDAETRTSIEIDNQYWRSPPEQPDLMRAACRALGLDVAAIDYSTLADGGIVIWEANPYFFLVAHGNYLLPAERQFEARFEAFHDALRRYLEDLLAQPAG